MLDRLLRQWPPLTRRHSARGEQAASAAADFLVESAALALRRACVGLPAPRRRAVERVLAGVARHYRQCSRAGHACTLPQELPAQIDAAFAALSATVHRSPRSALAALVILRLALLPQHTPIDGASHARH